MEELLNLIAELSLEGYSLHISGGSKYTPIVNIVMSHVDNYLCETIEACYEINVKLELENLKDTNIKTSSIIIMLLQNLKNSIDAEVDLKRMTNHARTL